MDVIGPLFGIAIAAVLALGVGAYRQRGTTTPQEPRMHSSNVEGQLQQRAEEPARRRPWGWIAGGVVALLLVLWFAGSLDKPLSYLGLNKTTCADALIGGRMCGDELVSFCRERYASTNADTCDQVLSEAGVDVEQIKAQRRAAERAFERCLYNSKTPSVDCPAP